MASTLNKLQKQARELAYCLPTLGGGHIVQSFHTNPILVGYRDYKIDKWITTGTVEIKDDEIYVNGELLTPDNRQDILERAKEGVGNGQTCEI